MKKLPFVFFALGLTGILSTGVVQVAIAQAKSEKTFTLDVACNGSTLALNPADPDDPPYEFDISAMGIEVMRLWGKTSQ